MRGRLASKPFADLHSGRLSAFLRGFVDTTHAVALLDYLRCVSLRASRTDMQDDLTTHDDADSLPRNADRARARSAAPT